jgi:hypothetical protein
MTLRLVLVSLVAALGLTVPGGPVIEHWVASTQNWMNARFADWDTRNPQETDYVIINDFLDVELSAPRPSVSSIAMPVASADRSSGPVPASKPQAARPAVDNVSRARITQQASFVRKESTLKPLVTRAPDHPGIALGPSRPRGGIGVPPSPAVHPAPARPGFEPIVVADNLYGGLAYELNRENEGIGINPPAPRRESPAPERPRAPSPPSFGPMEECESLYFAGRLEPPRRVVPVVAPSVVRVSSPAPEPVARAVQVAVLGWVASAAPWAAEAVPSEPGEDLFIDLAGELIRESDGFADRPRFEPIEPGEDLYPGIAYELNRRNEGIEIPLSSLAQTKTNDAPAPLPVRELDRAVKLTRDALYAWVNVLTGPAVVTVSKSSSP